MATAIGALQRNILDDYAATVGLTKEARYVGGARLRPVVPLDTFVGGIFIIGAYPSARFELVDGENDVPVGDNLGPFEPERYFDGARVRTLMVPENLRGRIPGNLLPPGRSGNREEWPHHGPE